MLFPRIYKKLQIHYFNIIYLISRYLLFRAKRSSLPHQTGSLVQCTGDGLSAYYSVYVKNLICFLNSLLLNARDAWFLDHSFPVQHYLHTLNTLPSKPSFFKKNSLYKITSIYIKCNLDYVKLQET